MAAALKWASGGLWSSRGAKSGGQTRLVGEDPEGKIYLEHMRNGAKCSWETREEISEERGP